jgi:hypothetical protein
MPLPIETLEAFFEAKFLFHQRVAQLTHFDGFAYWHLLWIPEDGQFLKIAADRESELLPFPTVEIEGRYSDDISISPLSGGVGVALILRPEATNETGRRVIVTKTKSGRLSLSTAIYETQSVA